MSHPFHVYIIQQIEERLKKHSVVVLYDPRCEFAPFTDELLHRATASGEGQWCQACANPDREQADFSRRLRRHHGARRPGLLWRPEGGRIQGPGIELNFPTISIFQPTRRNCIIYKRISQKCSILMLCIDYSADTLQHINR
jgi:hypothetical protein